MSFKSLKGEDRRTDNILAQNSMRSILASLSGPQGLES